MQSINTFSTRLWVRALAFDTRRLDKWLPYLTLLAQYLFILALLLLLCDPSWAASGSGSGGNSSGGNSFTQAQDPWSSSVQGLANMLSGPVAKGIGTIALFAAGGMLVFGGELNDFTKKICMVVIAISVMIMGGGMIATIFPS